MESPPQKKQASRQKALQKWFSFMNMFQQALLQKRYEYQLQPCGGMWWHEENKYLRKYQFQLPK